MGGLVCAGRRAGMTTTVVGDPGPGPGPGDPPDPVAACSCCCCCCCSVLRCVVSNEQLRGGCRVAVGVEWCCACMGAVAEKPAPMDVCTLLLLLLLLCVCRVVTVCWWPVGCPAGPVMGGCGGGASGRSESPASSLVR